MGKAMEYHAEVLRGGVWHPRIPDWRDLAATLLVLGVVILVGAGAHQMVAPFVAQHQPEISLSPAALPLYTLRTVMRMLAALVASLIFTFTYATLAAKSRHAETVLIPMLDVLQSVPILGYLSFYGSLLRLAVSRQRARTGVCGDLRDLHEPSLEHGLQLLSVAPDHPQRSR
jgi:NitT/TauT family transport system permease protein